MAAPDRIAVPRTIDDVPLIIGMRLDDFVVFMLALGMGFLFRQLFASALLGCVLVLVHRRLVAGGGRGYLQHLCYWHGLYPERGRSFRNAFLRRFLS